MLNNLDFNLIQVIGLTNDDPVSTEYRWLSKLLKGLTGPSDSPTRLQMAMAVVKDQIPM